jgi:hypothetical protein
MVKRGDATLKFRTFVALVLLTTSSLWAMNMEFSENRTLPPLKLSAADMDAILHKTHAFIATANGLAADDQSVRESVKLGVSGHEIEIPHFSLASSVAFPTELFKFSYIYSRPNMPVSSVIIDLGDNSRRVLVTGQVKEPVEAATNLIEKDLRRFSTPIGGASFRRSAGLFLTGLFLAFLGLGGAWWWRSRTYDALGMLVCSSVGLFLVLLLPWPKYLPGFALYQSYSPFLLIRYAPQIFSVILAVAFGGIILSYLLPPSPRRDN